MIQRLIAFISIILLLPLFFVLYLINLFVYDESFIFVQKRFGRDKKIFRIYKIRTMIKNATYMQKDYLYLNEADGPVFKIKNDPRFTSFGKLLSYTGLDELPQLVNIIKGEMAFVGPRPLPVEEAERVPKKYSDRFSVLPGITSLWVIQGAHKLSFKEWMELDIWYVQYKSVSLDFTICHQTFLLVIKCFAKYFKQLVN